MSALETNLNIARGAALMTPEPHRTVLLGALDRVDDAALDLANTINAIADPEDYETGTTKTAKDMRELAVVCISRNGL